jgi:hypothetical protein
MKTKGLFKKCMALGLPGFILAGLHPQVNAGILFQENFDDAVFVDPEAPHDREKSWYDSPRGVISTTERVSGAGSLQCTFLVGGQGCDGGTPGRRRFTPTEEVYVSFDVKHSANWLHEGHLFYILTTENDDFSGLAFTRLTAYIQEANGAPDLELQDGENIDQSQIRINRVGKSENRGANGCNGLGDGPVALAAFHPRYQTNDGSPDADCWSDGSKRINGKYFRTSTSYFQATPGPFYRGDWHHVEAYFKLNSINSSGQGVPDGQLRYWYDGQLILSYDDVLMRTGAHPDMKFNQFVIGPYLSVGSPITKTMWIDNLTVATSRPGASPPPSNSMPPASPKGLKVK